MARTSPKRVDRSLSLLRIRVPDKKKPLFFFKFKSFLRYRIRCQKQIFNIKLATYKKDSMIRLLIGSILFFIPIGSFAYEKQREIENEAINLVIQKLSLIHI